MRKIMVAISVFVLLAVSFAAGRISVHRDRCHSGESHTDTVIVSSVRVDTVKVSQPVAAMKQTVDTIYVHDFATVTVHDTVYVKLPKEERVYSDSLYKAQVSGYMPSLDWVEVYPHTKTVIRTVTVKPGKWSLGIQAGYGATKDGLSPYIGVGVGYSLLSW